VKRCLNVTRQTVLADELSEAYSFLARLRGLLFAPPIKPGQGLLIKPCNSIHMIGMKYAIDVVFLDKQNRVVGLVENIGPGKISAVYRKAHCCVELPSGTISATATADGDELALAPH
jgi:uncharacterized protein